MDQLHDPLFFFTQFWVFWRSPRWPVEPRSDASLLIRARFKKWFKEYTWVQYTSCLWPFVRVPLTEAVVLFCQFLKYEKDYNELTIRSRPDASSSPHRKVPSVFIAPRQIALLWFPFICPSAPARTSVCTHMWKYRCMSACPDVPRGRRATYLRRRPASILKSECVWPTGESAALTRATPWARMPLPWHTCEWSGNVTKTWM